MVNFEDFEFYNEETGHSIGHPTLKTLNNREKVVVNTPLVPRGEFAKSIFEEYTKRVGQYSNKESLITTLEKREGDYELIGSTAISVAIIDEIIRSYGVRTATLSDLSNPNTLEKLTNGKFHVDARQLFFWSTEDSENPYNCALARGLVPYLDEDKLPALLSGIRVEPSRGDNLGYSARFLPIDRLFQLHDDRLLIENNGKSFSEVDDDGLPIFDLNGKRKWYCRSEGIAGVSIKSDLSIVPNYNHRCVDECLEGRVMVVMDPINLI